MFLNALASYGRMLISAVAGLFTVPIALRELGPSNYGIFSVIAGTLSFLMFLNVALNTGAQRHVAHALGRNQHLEASEWLTVSLVVHSCLGALLLIVGVLLSHPLLLHLLKIPPARLDVAFDVYYLTIIAVVSDIISTPYRAYLMAHEAMVSISAVGSAGAVILCTGVLLLRELPGDKLLWYTAIYVFSQIVMFSGPSVYCLIAYPDSRRLQIRSLNAKRFKDLISFSGWMLFGALSGPARAQGPAVLLNRFAGSVVNAAYGIALQVSGFVAGISSGLIRATAPAIVKLEASGNREKMIWLSNLSNKYAVLLLWLGVGPLLVDPQHWLELWLTRVPTHTAPLLVFLLIALLSDQLTSGFMAAVQAHGRIAYYQMAVSMAAYLVIPLGYLFLKSGAPPSAATWAVVIGSVVANTLRLGFVRKMLNVDILGWATLVLLPSVLTIAVAALILRSLVVILGQRITELVLLLVVNALVTTAAAWFGARTEERRQWKAMVRHLMLRAGWIASLKS